MVGFATRIRLRNISQKNNSDSQIELKIVTLKPYKCSLKQYIRQSPTIVQDKKLQDPENKQFFTPDALMEPVFGNEKIRAFRNHKLTFYYVLTVYLRFGLFPIPKFFFSNPFFQRFFQKFHTDRNGIFSVHSLKFIQMNITIILIIYCRYKSKFFAKNTRTGLQLIYKIGHPYPGGN